MLVSDTGDRYVVRRGVLRPALNRLAVVVRQTDGRHWLLTADRRYQLADNTLAQLRLGNVQQVALPDDVLETVPEGREITVPAM